MLLYFSLILITFIFLQIMLISVEKLLKLCLEFINFLFKY